MPTEKDPIRRSRPRCSTASARVRRPSSTHARLDRDHSVASPGTGQSALPRTDQLFSPAEVVDSVFDFAAQPLTPSVSWPTACLAPPPRSASQSSETEKAAGTAKKSTKR